MNMNPIWDRFENLRNHFPIEALGRNSSVFNEKWNEKEISRDEKWLRFSIGERGRSQMPKTEDGDAMKGVQGLGILQSLLFKRRMLLAQAEFQRQHYKKEDHPIDELDQATILIFQKTESKLNRKRACELRRVQGAIERWERGTYGRCVACDESIGKRRLLVVPETEFCLGCKQTLERKEHEYTH